jgi:hypothetical protein
MPIFLSTPPSEDPMELPFKFTGGLALSTKNIGYMLAVQGFYSLFAQIYLFPFLTERLGTLRTLRLALFVWTPLYFAVPYLVLLPSALQVPAAYVALLGKITLHVICFPATNMLLANTVSSPTVLGSVNGLASSVASLSRALGPSITGLLHSKGLHSGFSIIAWWALGIVCVIGAFESLLLQNTDQKTNNTPENDTQNTELSLPEEEVRLLSSIYSNCDAFDEAETLVDDTFEKV